MAVAEILLNRGVDTHTTDIRNRIPLQIAIEKDNHAVVAALVAHDEKDDSRGFAYAMMHGDRDMIDRMIACGTEIRDFVNQNYYGCPLLFSVVAAGRSDMVDLLLQLGADANAKDNFGSLVLHHCANRSDPILVNPEVVKVLIRRGLDVNARDGLNRRTALQYLVKMGENGKNPNRDVIKIILDNRGEVHNEELHEAVYFFYADIVKLLLASGVEVEKRDARNCTPLHIAMRFRPMDIMFDHSDVLAQQREIVEALVHYGANVAPQSNDGFTPLFAGVIGVCDPFIFDLLLEKGAWIEDKWTPLHLAAARGQVSDVKECLKKGDVVNAREKNDLTPLHLALWRSHNNVVEVLLENAADPNLADEGGITPLHIGAWLGSTANIKMLLQAGASCNSIAPENERYCLGPPGVYVDGTSLHFAMLSALFTLTNGIDNIVCLLNAGADVNARNFRGVTALHLAANEGNEDAYRLLLRRGADPTISAYDSGETSFHFPNINASRCHMLITESFFVPFTERAFFNAQESEDNLLRKQEEWGKVFKGVQDLFQKRILYLILILKHFGLTKVKDLTYYVLASDAEFLQDIFQIVGKNIRVGLSRDKLASLVESVPPFLRTLIIEWLYSEKMKKMKEVIKSVKPNQECKELLDLEKFDENFGEPVRNHLQQRLGWYMLRENL